VARAERAVLYAEAGAEPEALKHLSRSQDILAGGADWRGIAGKVRLAEALLAGQRAGPEAAGPAFEEAIGIFRRYSTPWLEARALEEWGRIQARGRRRSDAARLRREAESLYRRIGAGEPWLERLRAMSGASGSRLN
jgi:hypothetical protein